MANNRATFIIDVVSKGLKAARDSVSGLGKEARMASGAYSGADKAAKDFHNTQAKGVIGTANSTKSFSKLAETMNGGGGIVGAYATLAANIFAVSAAFNALRSAAQVQQVLEGLNASGARTGQTLSVAASRVKDLSNNLLSSEQAMRSTAQVMSAGFNTKELENLTKVAKDVSFALGRNMQDSMDRLTRGVVKLEPELLDELGIMTKIGESNALYAAQLGKTESALTNFEKRQGFLNAVVAEATLKFGGLSDAAGSTTAYDKVAAQFSDLTKSIFNFINIAAIPLATVFGMNGTGLAGLMLLLGSTISKQLLPGLTNISGKAKEAADGMRGLAQSNLAAYRATADNFSSHKTYIDSVLKGNVTLDERNARLKKINDSIARYETISTRVAEKEAKNQALNKQERLIAGGSGAARNATEIEVRKRLLEFEATSARAGAKDLASSAINNASQGSFGQGLNQLQSSITAYGNVTDAAGKKTGVLQKGMFALGNSAQFAGAAFLRFLPWIGAIVVAIGLLKAGWESMKSDELKILEQRTADLEEILSKAGDKAKELNKITSSSATIAQRTAAAYILEGNAVTELTNAYNEQRLAKSLLDKAKEEKEKGGGGNYGFNEKSLRNGTEILQWLTSLGAKSEGVNTQFQEFYSGLDRGSAVFKTFGGDLDRNALQTMDKLRILSPEVYKEAVKAAGGIEKIASGNVKERMSALNQVVDIMNGKLAGLAEATKSVQEAFSNTNKAISSFLVGAVDTTPYDTVVEGMESIQASMFQLQIEAAKAGKDNSASLVASMGPDQMKLLTNSSRIALEQVKSNDMLVQGMQDRIDKGGTLNQQEQMSFELAKFNLKNSDQVLAVAQEELLVQRNQFVQAQELTRLSKSRQMIAEAHLSANKRNYEATGKGLIAQMKAENAIKDIQILQINSQKAIIQAAIEKNKLALEETKYVNDINTALERQYLIRKVLERQQAALTAETEFAAKYGSSNVPVANDPEWTRLNNARVQAKRDMDAANKVLADVQTRMGAQTENRALSAARDALSAQAQALQISKNTAGERRAEAYNLELGNMRKRYDMLVADRAMIQDTIAVENKLAIIRSGRSIRLSEEVKLMRLSYLESVKQANKEANDRRTELLGEREIVAVARERAAGDQEALGANSERQSQIATELNDLDRSRQIRLDNLKKQYELNVAEKLMFDTRKEGLDIQKDAVSYLEKQLEVTRSSREATREISMLNEDIARKRRGAVSTPGFEDGRKIEAAVASYKAAQEEAGLKKSVIRLEFALLEAQKDMLRIQLADRRQAMIEAGNYSETAIAQLDKTLETLGSVDVSAILNDALGEVDKRVEIARKTMISAATRENTRGAGDVRQQILDNRRTEELRRETLAAGANKVESKEVGVVKGEPVVKGPELALRNVSSTNERLIKTLDKLILTLEGKMSVAEQNSATRGSATGTIHDAAAMAKRGGLSVKENDAYGWMTPGRKASDRQGHSRNSAHYTNNAIDINAPGVGIEANDKTWGPRFDALAEEYRKMGYKVLWRTAGHFNHMHVEMTSAVVKSAEKGTAATVAAVQDTHDHANDKVDDIAAAVTTPPPAPATPAAANDNVPTATVTGTPLPKNRQPGNSFTDGKTQGFFDNLNIATAELQEQLGKLGPEGEMVLGVVAGFEKIAESIDMNLNDLMSGSVGDKITAGAAIATAVLSTISSVTQASSDAKIAGIDKEIAAEQRRDGKSAESVAKIQSLEKRKDAVARKSFNTQKKLMMAQAVVSTAAAVANALATGFPPTNFIMAGIAGAMGAAQLAIIAGTSYQSTANANFDQKSMPSTLTIGKRGDGVDVSKHNTNVGGELGYLRGARGSGSNSSNYATIGSAYGGPLPRGYGHNAFVVGEKGPEVIERDTPISVRPMNDNTEGAPAQANFHIQAFDGESVNQMLNNRRGDIIDMLREAANANGTRFMEDVNTNHYKKAGAGGGRRI